MPAKRGRSISNMGYGLFAGTSGGVTGIVVELADITFELKTREVEFALTARDVGFDLKKREVELELKP